MINSIIIVGNLGNDPELNIVGDDKKVCTFRVAVERGYKDKNGESQTDWLPVKVWNKYAESCEKHLSKGDQVAIEGSLHTSSYTDNDGNKRSAFEISASKVQFLKTKNSNAENSD